MFSLCGRSRLRQVLIAVDRILVLATHRFFEPYQHSNPGLEKSGTIKFSASQESSPQPSLDPSGADLSFHSYTEHNKGPSVVSKASLFHDLTIRLVPYLRASNSGSSGHAGSFLSGAANALE
jgi:hypothetical protein